MNFDSNGKKIPTISPQEKIKALSKNKAEMFAEGRRCKRCRVLVEVVFDESYGQSIIQCPNCKRSVPVFVKH